MIPFTFDIQRPVYWPAVTSCFVVLAALSCCNGLQHEQTAKTANSLRSASESFTTLDMSNQPKAVTVDLGSLLDAGDGAIVTLVVGDTRLAAHRTVLAAGSPVLAAMFRPDALEASDSEIEIQGVEGPVLRQLVAFLYTGRTPQLPGMAMQLLAAAKIYGMSALRNSIEQQVAGQLTVENLVASAVMAQRYASHTLRKATIEFMSGHLEVLATKDWAEAVLNHPGEVLQITHLLAEQPEKTSVTTTTDSRPISTATIAANPDTTDSAFTSTTSTPAAPMGENYYQPREATSSFLSRVTTATDSRPVSTATIAATPDNADSTFTSTVATPSTPTTEDYTQPPDATAIFLLRSLSAEEKASKLRLAAYEGSVQKVRALIAVGADVRAKDRKGWSALHYAAAYGHTDVVQLLLVVSADPNARDGIMKTPLHWGAGSGRAAVVRLLVEASADLNARDEDGWAPLHQAALWGHAEAAAALLQAGADKDATDNKGRTALDIAKRHHRQQLIQMLQ